MTDPGQPETPAEQAADAAVSSAPTPLDQFDDPPAMSGDSGAVTALSKFLTRSPFLDLHDRAGGDHARRAVLCFTLDLIVRLLVILLILGIIAAVVWKTISPVPDL